MQRVVRGAARARRGSLACGMFALCTLLLAGCWRDPKLPELGAVPAFALMDQDGQPIDDAKVRGRVWIANFMFTSCPDVCPMLTARLAQVRTKLADERQQMRFVSFTVDPGHDSPPVLKKYAGEHGVDQPDWRFATGSGDALQHVIVSGFKQTLQPLAASEGKARSILHGSHFVLVDDAMKMRGFYPTDPEGLARLVRDARILVRRASRRS